MSYPVLLEASFREKIWGSTRLAPWFPDSEKKIGEVWFTAAEELPILVKFVFTSGRLSVQVHPDDEYAASHEGSRGKTEMWRILRADPGAEIALGFREPIGKERLREAAQTGEIEKLLNWIPAHAGETYFTPAGTVHAIGAGLAICEIQQQSDVTYRLYDYGRPRELHLDKAVEVAHRGSHAGRQDGVELPGRRKLLAECEYFRTEWIPVEGKLLYDPCPDRLELLIATRGAGCIGGSSFSAGQAWMIPAGTEPFPLSASEGAEFLRTYVP